MNKTHALMKHCASVLRNRAANKESLPTISTLTARYLSRKELINIIKKRFKENIPKEYNLIEMENTELLKVIGDEMFIISYLTARWCTMSYQKTHH